MQTEKPIFTRNMKLILGGFLITIGLLYLLRSVAVPVAFSFLLAYFLDPLVDWFEAKKISRTLGIVIIGFLLLILLTLGLLIFIPLIAQEIEVFVNRLPALLNGLEGRIVPLIEKWTGIEAAEQLDHGGEQLLAWLKGMDTAALSPVKEIAAHIFSGTYSAAMAIISLSIIPVFLFYFLRDFDTLKMIPVDYVPPRHREEFLAIFREIDEKLAGFVRGQGMVCILLALMYGVGYQISGVPLGILIGLVAGIVSFIPYFGTIVGVILAVLMSFLDWQGFMPFVGIAITVTVAQSLESFVITPRIVGDKVGLSPVMVIIALMVGGELLGFTGILIAVPAAAILNILFHRAAKQYKATDFFKGDEA